MNFAENEFVCTKKWMLLYSINTLTIFNIQEISCVQIRNTRNRARDRSYYNEKINP